MCDEVRIREATQADADALSGVFIASFGTLTFLPKLHTDEETSDFIARHQRVYVVDQNRDRQMYELLTLEVREDCGKLRSIRHYDGFPLDAETVVEGVEAGEKS